MINYGKSEINPDGKNVISLHLQKILLQSGCLYLFYDPAHYGMIVTKIDTNFIHLNFFFPLTFRHWLATYFVIRYGVPYMTYDIFAMYLSHYHRFRVKGHEDYKGHSLRTISSFVRREFLLVLHHIALLTILLPVTLVRKGVGKAIRGTVEWMRVLGVLQHYRQLQLWAS